MYFLQEQVLQKLSLKSRVKMKVFSAVCPILTLVKPLESEFSKTSCCKSVYFMIGTSRSKLNWGQIFGSSRICFWDYLSSDYCSKLPKYRFLPCFEIIVTLVTLIFVIPSLQILLFRPRCIPWYLKIVLDLDSTILSIGCFLHNCGLWGNRRVICQTSVMNTFAAEENIIKLVFRQY